MVTLTERTIMKSRSGVYSDTSENRRKHRVGQRYGAEKQPEDREKTEKKEADPAKELEAVNMVIAAINEGKLNLPNDQIMVLVEKKSKLEAAKKQAEKINAGVKANEEKKNAKEAKETSKKINEAQKKEASKELSETDKDDLREARRKLSYLQDNEERLIKRDGKEKYDKRVKQVKEVIAKLRGEKPKESQKPEYFDRTGYKPIYRMNEEEADKFISDAKKYLSKNKDAKDVEQVQDVIRKVELRKEEIKEASKELSETDKDDLREARRKLSYLQDNEERLIKRDGKEKYDKRVKQVKEVIAKLRGEKPKESQKPEYFDRTGYKPIYRMNEEEADKFISDAKKYLSKNKDAKDVEQVQDVIRKVELRKEEIKETSNEEAEVYTRIKFDDVPNSGKVNLKKYLSEKVRQGVDEKWSNIKNIPTDNLKKMEKGLVNDLNKNFEAIKKSQRAELLYSIMKVKGELEKRGKESQKKE